MKKYRLIIFSIIFYFVFSVNKELPTFEAVLFANDFSKPNVLDWLVYSIKVYAFLIFIGGVGFRRVEKTMDKLFFVALIFDGVISIFAHVIFGYNGVVELSYFINSIPLGIIIYSQFIHGKLH